MAMKSPVSIAKEWMHRLNVWEYRKNGLLSYSLLCNLLLDGARDPKGRQLVYRAVKNRYMARLRRRYRPVIEAYLKENPGPTLQSSNPPKNLRTHSNKVWVCWLQGFENVPDIVKACHASLLRHLPPDRELIEITEANLSQYVELPDFVWERYRAGRLSMAHLSDLIRVNLLIRYGGTWVDATVFLSDGNLPAAMLDADLYLPQFCDPLTYYGFGTGFDDRCLAVSNWFISSCTNNEILLLVRHLVYHNLRQGKAGDYFIFHYMMQLAFETYPEQWRRIPFLPAKSAFSLQERLLEPFDAQTWELMKRGTPMHKLSYKRVGGKTPEPDSFYGKLLAGELDG